MALRPAWILLVTAAAGIAATPGVASAGTLEPGQHTASAHHARHAIADSDGSGVQHHRGGHDPDDSDAPRDHGGDHDGHADHVHGEPAQGDVVSTPFNNLG